LTPVKQQQKKSQRAVSTLDVHWPQFVSISSPDMLTYAIASKQNSSPIEIKERERERERKKTQR